MIGRAGETIFDRYLVVDWSAAGRPVTGANSIWIAEAGAGEVVLTNPPTRSEAEHLIRDRLASAGEQRTLLAIDVSLGYPAGAAELLGLAGIPWAAMWAEVTRLVEDDEANRNNRFEAAAALNERATGPGPFWGCPASRAGPTLSPRRPPSSSLDEFRLTERRLIGRGRRPKSGWQLAYAGSVGSQTLTALPMLERLRRSFLDRITIWPFEGADRPPTGPGSIVVAEIYPSSFEITIPAASVLDAAQVASVAERLHDADRSGELGTWFEPQLSAAERSLVEAEEGWVLGPHDVRPVR